MTSPAVIVIDFHAKPGHEQTLRDGLGRALHASTDASLLGGQVLIDDHDPAHIQAVQSWTSAEAFHEHINQAGGFGALAPILTTDPVARTFTVHATR